MFQNHLISLCDDIGLPARSPDLNPCDFFLWGYLKSKVFTYHPQSLKELKQVIHFEIAAIPLKMIHQVIESFHERLQLAMMGNISLI